MPIDLIWEGSTNSIQTAKYARTAMLETLDFEPLGSYSLDIAAQVRRGIIYPMLSADSSFWLANNREI